jgi:hypothetical protein
MSDALRDALADPGPHTAESLSERLPHFPVHAIREALDLLAGQGVLERTIGAGGTPEYRYVAPERYAQINLDVVRDPAKQFGKKAR